MAGFDYSVLIGGPEKREIRIVPYDPTWPDQYEEHRRTISLALGQRLIVIHHIGSTSVPGLAAKPIIDILVIVADSSDESSYVPDLEAAGYVLRVRDPKWHEHRMLRTPSRSAHVHVFSSGAAEINRYLVFRGRLRENSADRLLYEQTKRRLALRSWDDANDYADAKSSVVESIIAAVRSPGPSLELLYLLTTLLLLIHQIDSAYWHEWRLFGIPGGIQIFLLGECRRSRLVPYGFHSGFRALQPARLALASS